MNISSKKVLAYTLLPQVAPRFRFLMSGFTFVAFFLAQVYRSVGLLPKGHPYLMPANIGRYGITHVVAEAGLLLKRRNASIDQIIVYWLLMLGLVVLAGQFVLLLLGVLTPMAHAGAIGVNTNFFITDNPTNDLAFMLMDRVFGVDKTMFGSCVAQQTVCLNSALAATSYWNDTAHTASTVGPFPTPFNMALRSGFQLYSVALLCIGALILCYFVFAILAETAESGTPFGRRFNKVWAPLRLVMAMGLLIPMANGLNAAQYITLYAAKFGSGFATNGWNLFVQNAVTGTDTLFGPKKNLVAIPNAPPMNTLVAYFAIVSTCKQGIEGISKNAGDATPREIKAFQINPANKANPYIDASFNYQKMQDYAGKGNIIIRFGEDRKDEKGNYVYTSDTSNVEPTCGEVIIPATNTQDEAAPGAATVMEIYTDLLDALWKSAGGASSAGPAIYQTGYGMVSRDISGVHPDPDSPLPTLADMQKAYDLFLTGTQTAIDSGVTDQANDSTTLNNSATDLTEYGWAGAGIWYNRIAQVNGNLLAATFNLPVPSKMPEVMEQIQKANLQTNRDTAGENRYRPYGANGQDMNYLNKTDAELGVALQHAYDWWAESTSPQNVSSNIFIDAINAIFGTNGLFNMSKNMSQNIHPLAQLAAAGRGILESAVRNLGWAGAAGLGGGLINIESNHLVGTVGMAASGFLWSFALTGLSIGFVLFYIVPFLPFIYFFFAVGSWVKTIFEAMVGVPLWALAHLRIDGQGLPGDAAMGGYFLILEIFLRPILIIFGMVGGIVIFSAQASILNEIWSLVTSNVTGFNRDTATATGTTTGALTYLRDAIDQLFFSVIYAIMIYMLGTSTFKMVDQVPTYVLRWMGANVQTFSDQQGEHAADHLLRNSFAGTQQLSGMMKGASPGALGESISKAGQSFSQRNSG